jgi:integrase
MTVRKREIPPPSALSKQEAHDHFKRTLDDWYNDKGEKVESKWKVLKGWHVLRHSFISACASARVDQRFIDDWVGHSTEQQRKRYRHLYPSTQEEAIAAVFATGNGTPMEAHRKPQESVSVGSEQGGASG